LDRLKHHPAELRFALRELLEAACQSELHALEIKTNGKEQEGKIDAGS
jgi:hypothetical protein